MGLLYVMTNTRLRLAPDWRAIIVTITIVVSIMRTSRLFASCLSCFVMALGRPWMVVGIQNSVYSRTTEFFFLKKSHSNTHMSRVLPILVTKLNSYWIHRALDWYVLIFCPFTEYLLYLHPRFCLLSALSGSAARSPLVTVRWHYPQATSHKWPTVNRLPGYKLRFQEAPLKW